MARIIAPSRARSIGELTAVHHGVGTPCGRTRGETQRIRPRFREGRSTEEDDDSRDGRTLHRRPNTYPELRSRVAACVGRKMIQQSCAPMGIAKVEGEAEGSHDQIDELRKPRRDERSTHQRGLGKQPWKAPPSGRHEKREADNGQDNAKNQKQKKQGISTPQLPRQGTPSETVPDTCRSLHPSC